jgi:hypothetical protein
VVEATEEDFMAMFGTEMDFKTSKNKDHTKDSREACYKSFLQKREYRQFMNKRPGAQNKPGPL